MVPLLQGRSRSAGPSSPILPQYQENLLDDVPPIPESASTRHGSARSQEAQREDIYAASPARGKSVAGPQQSARQWHRNILQRAETSRSNGNQPSWANVVPLSLLGRWAAVVECPLCKELTRTTLRHEVGKGTHLLATVLFFTTAVGSHLGLFQQERDIHFAGDYGRDGTLETVAAMADVTTAEPLNQQHPEPTQARPRPANFDFDRQHLLRIFFILSFSLPSHSCGVELSMAALQIFLTTVLLAALLTIGGAIRRLFLHPLAHIPGPRLAALTWWYEFYFDAIKPGQYVFKVQELHKQYGPIIRVTPDEIHISDVGFLDTIYAPSSSPRDKYEYQLRTLRVPGGVGTTPSLEVHRKRREALSPFFSKRNVVYLEPTITEKVQQLCQLLLKHASEQTPVNLSDVFFAFSNDVVNNFLFSQRTDTLSDEQKAATLRHNSYELMMGIHLNKHFPFIPDFLESLPESISRPIMPPGLLDMLDLFDRVRAELVGIIKAKDSGAGSDSSSAKSVYYNVLDSPILPAPEKSLLRLEQEGALLVLAGTESPAKSLNMIFYHLLANPQIMSKLREELSTVAQPASWTQLEQLPYLTAVIEEAHRLSFGVTTRTARIARETLIYTPTSHAPDSSKTEKSFKIPSGTPMSTTTLSAHTAPSVFPDPFVFDPERWLGDEGRKLQKYQMSFGKGSRKCLGIELARAEMYLVTAALVQGFDMNLWKTEASDVAFVHDYHVSMPSVEFKGLEAMITAL